MTIFRFSAALLAVVAAACTDRLPPADTELSRIVKIQDYTEAASQLQHFAEARLTKHAALQQEFEKAGFKRSTYRDGPDQIECERFAFRTKAMFPSVYAVDICADHVFANAGQLAP